MAFLIAVCHGLPFNADVNNEALLSFGAEETKLQDYINLLPRVKRQTGSDSKGTDLCPEDKFNQVISDHSRCDRKSEELLSSQLSSGKSGQVVYN